MSGPETITAAFNSLLALLADARNEMGHDPSAGRAISIAITHAENAQLWADKAFSGQQAVDEGAAIGGLPDFGEPDEELDEFLDTAEVVEDDPTDGAPIVDEDPE
jgi:hypothetical protein